MTIIIILLLLSLYHRSYSIINKPGGAPSESDWGRLLSLFTVSAEDMATTRR